MADFRVGGLIPSPGDPRDFHIPYGADREILPKSWKPAKGTFKIHDQGRINSCVAHAITGQYELQGNPEMSYGWIYGNRRHTMYKEEGMVTRDALKAAQKDGVVELKQFSQNAEVPEIIRLFETQADSLMSEANKHRIGNYYRLNSEIECKQAMFDGKCVVLGLFLFEGMIDMGKGTDPMITAPDLSKDPNAIGGHLVGGFGWDERGVRFCNSWAEIWGEKGCGYLDPEIWTWNQKNSFPIPLVEAWAFDLEEEATPPRKDIGWYKDEKGWRYFNGKENEVGWLHTWAWFWLGYDGYMCTGWQKVSGHWYYFNGSGVMQTGFITIGSKKYYLNEKTSNGIPEGALIVTNEKGEIQI